MLDSVVWNQRDRVCKNKEVKFKESLHLQFMHKEKHFNQDIIINFSVVGFQHKKFDENHARDLKNN